MGLLRVGHDWATSLSLFTFMRWRRKWQPTPVFLPGESQGRGSLVAAIYGVTQSRTRLKWLSSSSSSKASQVKPPQGFVVTLWGQLRMVNALFLLKCYSFCNVHCGSAESEVMNPCSVIFSYKISFPNCCGKPWTFFFLFYLVVSLCPASFHYVSFLWS